MSLVVDFGGRLPNLGSAWIHGVDATGLGLRHLRVTGLNRLPKLTLSRTSYVIVVPDSRSERLMLHVGVIRNPAERPGHVKALAVVE